jgi:hypothetical protein
VAVSAPAAGTIAMDRRRKPRRPGEGTSVIVESADQAALLFGTAWHLDGVEAIGEGRFLPNKSANVWRESVKRANGA